MEGSGWVPFLGGVLRGLWVSPEEGGYVQGVGTHPLDMGPQDDGMSKAVDFIYKQIWDTTGYGWHAGSMHPTVTLSCYLIVWSILEKLYYIKLKGV